MKKRKNAIEAQHVFTEDNKIFLRKITLNKSGNNSEDNQNEWVPISFQWTPIAKL